MAKKPYTIVLDVTNVGVNATAEANYKNDSRAAFVAEQVQLMIREHTSKEPYAREGSATQASNTAGFFAQCSMQLRTTEANLSNAEVNCENFAGSKDANYRQTPLRIAGGSEINWFFRNSSAIACTAQLVLHGYREE